MWKRSPLTPHCPGSDAGHSRFAAAIADSRAVASSCPASGLDPHGGAEAQGEVHEGGDVHETAKGGARRIG